MLYLSILGILQYWQIAIRMKGSAELEEHFMRNQFSERAKAEFRKKPDGSYFLNVDLIHKYSTSIAIPTASKEVTFDIDDNGNLRLSRPFNT